MKYLGRGWQYTTYDLGNGRVLKRYNLVLIGYAHMLKACFPFTKEPIWKLPAFYRGCKETAADSMKKLPALGLEPWMMGNPKVLNELDYEQDKLIPLHAHFRSVDTERAKKTIDSFVAFSTFLVEKSVIDKSFNMARNFALDAQGRIVLMDLGELYSSKAAIDKQIRSRAWAATYNVAVLPRPLRNYFVASMDEAFQAS